MRGKNTIRISKRIDTSEEGKKQLEVFRAFVESGLSQFEGMPFEATLEIREIPSSKKS